MALLLSASDLEMLEAALSIAAAPLDFGSPEAWGMSLLLAVESLLGADQGFVGVPTAEGIRVQTSDPRGVSALQDYALYYHRLDTGFMQKRRELGLEVYHSDSFTPPDEIRRTELYADWLAPNGLLDALGMGVQLDAGPLPAGINVYHATRRRKFGAKGVALLRLLLPAFKAGSRVLKRASETGRGMTRWFDALGGGVLVHDITGRVVHATERLETLLGEELEKARVLEVMAEVARAVASICRSEGTGSRAKTVSDDAALQPIERELATGMARYRIRGTLLHAPAGTASPLIAVSVERISMRAPTIDALRARWGLTRREAEVALVLARGATNAVLAAALGISPHTAERHTERVLQKLGIRSRAAVAAAIGG